MNQQLLEQVNRLPSSPGVYLMLGGKEGVIYVGKALSLVDRVGQYFSASNPGGHKHESFLEKIDQIEYIVTASETEALVLESNLIKKYRPRYNVLFKDDKQFPYIRINMKEKYPALEIVRKIEDDGARYFGPFPNSSIVKPSLKFLAKYFPLRTCRLMKKSVCLNYHIKKCSGPCENKISESDYKALCEEVVMFLQGRYEGLKTLIEQKMKELSDDLQFERAAFYRNRLLDLRQITQRQKIILGTHNDVDVIAWDNDGKKIYLCIITYRGGYLISQHNYQVEDCLDRAVVIAQGIIQHYLTTANYPDEVLIGEDIPDLQKALAAASGKKASVLVPISGEKAGLISVAARNVRKYIQDRQQLYPENKEALQELQKVTGLGRMPRTIVGFDISHLSGTNRVASAVFFENGRPDKKRYRKFVIRSESAGEDDYRAMEEVVGRYFGKWPEVDLILIDGGKGQLAAALLALSGTQAQYLGILSLAKKEEEVYLPGQSAGIRLGVTNPGLHLLQRVRDEAHRFAISHQRQRRNKRATSSALEEIQGISVARRKKLILYFGSVDAIKKASPDDIMGVPGIGKKMAQDIYDALH